MYVFSFICKTRITECKIFLFFTMTDVIVNKEEDVISPAVDASDGSLCFYDVLADYFVRLPEKGKPILDLIVQLWSQSFASHIFALLFHKWVCELVSASLLSWGHYFLVWLCDLSLLVLNLNIAFKKKVYSSSFTKLGSIKEINFEVYRYHCWYNDHHALNTTRSQFRMFFYCCFYG